MSELRSSGTDVRAACSIAVVPEILGNVFSPCASIRVHAFLEAMKTRGEITVRYLLPRELARFRGDVILWHRTSIRDPDELNLLQRVAADTGAKKIYDLDDNLLDLESHVERSAYAGLRETVSASLAVADEVWVSTQRLQQRVGRETLAEIVLLPNALDLELWCPHRASDGTARSRRGPLRLLYMGTRTHDADFALLRDALECVERRKPGGVELTLVGVNATQVPRYSWLRVLNPPAYVGASYPAFVAWFAGLSGFDLGVAPLIASEFNDCKSPIKVLDYAAIDLPTFASRVPAYADTLVDVEHCRLLDNTPEAWSEALLDVLERRESLDGLLDGARRLIDPSAFERAVAARAARLRGAIADGATMATSLKVGDADSEPNGAEIR
jgi:glycosyltransferase involved in cell wall biosynthesis